MPTLTLRFKSKNLRRFQFKQGTAITIGRSADNQIIIENLAVSSNHAKIDSVGDSYLLTDLKSKNGTFVNEKPISTHWLRHGDNIGIAKHNLIFANAENDQHPETEDSIMGQSEVMQTDSAQNVRSQNGSNTEKAAQKFREEPVGALAYLHGGYGEIELNKNLIRFGKSTDSDIIISGLMVGKTSFIISKRKNGYYLSYVGGLLKPKVNGDVIKETIQLKDLDTIDIGSVAFQFIENS
jgi:hypothetical protein